MPAILAILTERGPAHSREALAELKRERRVRPGATMCDAYKAAEMLAADGQLEHVKRSGATGGGYFRVPGDKRLRWDH